MTVGSGKTVKSGPNDHIFVFYSDHGAPGVNLKTLFFSITDDEAQ